MELGETLKKSRIAVLFYRLLTPLVDIAMLEKGVVGYSWYFRDLLKYVRKSENESIRLIDLYPILNNRGSHEFDPHYFYQSLWLFQRIKHSRPKEHLDIGSDFKVIALLSTLAEVTFLDFRPLKVKIPNLMCISGSILDLPFRDKSQKSVSCLHVAEHIGLGRYGDSLDPDGTRKAIRELARVLAPEGNLYFSIPVGRERVCFNAHRVLSPERIIEWFRREGVQLKSFAAVGDDQGYHVNASPSDFANSEYACGLFLFSKNA